MQNTHDVTKNIAENVAKTCNINKRMISAKKLNLSLNQICSTFTWILTTSLDSDVSYT